MTCSASLEERPLVGSSKRKMSALPIISRPMFRRLRSPPLRIFFVGLPTRLPRRSLKPEFRPACRRCAARGRVLVRCGARIAAANSRFSSMVRCSSKASSCGMWAMYPRSDSRSVIERLPVEQHLAVQRLELPCQDAHERALAAAARAHDADHFAAASPRTKCRRAPSRPR